MKWTSAAWEVREVTTPLATGSRPKIFATGEEFILVLVPLLATEHSDDPTAMKIHLLPMSPTC
jgi:hypothetical protein